MDKTGDIRHDLLLTTLTSIEDRNEAQPQFFEDISPGALV